ncbi:MAG: MFS transporter [Azoarcus sp.]|nr:MFS transporter [Azoarcus sp.]
MIFTRGFVVLALVNLMVMTAYYLLFIVSAPYASEMFRATPSEAGLAAGLILVGCLAGRFVIGGLLHTLGYKRVLFSGLVLYTASLLLYPMAGNLAMFMVVRFLSGLGVGCIGTVTATLIACMVPAHLSGQGIGYFSMSSIVALALGPFFGILLMQHLPFEWIFLFCALFGLISLGIAAMLDHPAIAENPARHSFRIDDFVEFSVMPICGIVALISIGYGCLQAFLSFHAQALGLAHEASLFFLVYAITAFVLRPFAGKIFDRRGPNWVIYPALAVTTLGFLALGLTHSPWLLLFSGVLLGIGIGNFHSTAQATVIKNVSKARIGQATSTFFIFLDLGIGIGPYLLGHAVSRAGYPGLFFMLALLSFLCLPLYHIAHDRKPVPDARRNPD